MTRADVFDVEKRAAIMRAVKSNNTKPELRVRAAVRALGVGYRLGGRELPGKPDLTFPGKRACIFVHGCFWHGHDCTRGARAPKDNAAYWSAKIARNKARDARVIAELGTASWRPLVIWECETRDGEALREKVSAFLN
ncbi:MAG: very short patch repair endonuclease [Caulobacterales bacterium]